MQELSLLPFYTSPDNVPEKLFSWLSAPFSGDLPMPEGSKNQLVIIDDDRPNRHQIIMLLPVNKEELISTFILDSDTDTDVIPLPCDQDACIAWNYKGHVNALDLSETVVESERFETKAKRVWEVTRTMGQNGDIIYQWYDQDGHLHTLSEWEFQRRLSVYFQSLLEYLYPEFFDSALPAGGGWHRWQYKNVRQASDRPEKNDQSLWQVQGRGKRRKKGAKPVAAVRPVPVKHTGSQPDWQQCRRYGRNEASTSSSSADQKEAIDALIKEFETGELQRRANWFGQRYDGINHSRFCNEIKKLTQDRKAPLDHAEKCRFEPFMNHLSVVVNSFNGKNLSTCVHSLTASGLLDPHPHHNVRTSQQHLLEKLLDAIESQTRQPHKTAILDAQAVSNHLLSLAKLVEREALTPEQTSPAVTALLLQVKNYQADFIPQHVANQLWALAKLVEHEVFTPEQASPAVTALLQQVQDYQAKFSPQEVANQLWALAKLMEHEVFTPEQASPAVTTLLSQVQYYQAKFNPQQIVNQLWALAKLVERKVSMPEQTSLVVTALLVEVQKHQAKFKSQGIANQLWALAKLVERGILMLEQDNPAVTALLQQVQEHQAKFSPQQIANQLWALAKLVECKVSMPEQISPAVTALLSEVQEHQAKFNPQEVANQLWALAKLVENEIFTSEQTSPALMVLLQEAQDHQAKFLPQGIANQLWALAKLMERGFLMLEQVSPTLMALLQQVQKHQAKFKSQEIASLLWGLAVFGDWVTLDTISNILGMLNIDAFESSQSQEMALWALTVFLARGLDQPAVKPSIMKLYKTLKNEEKKVSSESRGSILRLSGVWLEENLQDLPIPDYKSIVSKSQTTLYDNLTKKFPNRTFETEASVDGLPPVDLLFSREKVVIEIQGSHHYLDREKQIRTGSTILKITTYQKLGYKVIEVHASDVSEHEIQKELHRKLLTHFSKTDDDSVHNSCDSSDWDRDEEDDERFSAED